MSHEIDMTNNRANVAFLGSRNEIWHRMGQEMKPGMTIEEWSVAAGLNWEAIKVPAIPALEGPRFDHIDAGKRFLPVVGQNFLVRSDNGHPLGYVSDRYQPVQPREVLDWFQRYISVDERFELDVAGSLYNGEMIWATATFNGDLTIAGENHKARLLMSTTFDGSGATLNQGTVTRVVCRNTLAVAHADSRSVIRTRHSTKFDAAKVGKELAAVATGFVQFKAMGDAMAQTDMARDQVSSFFKQVLDIPFEAKQDEVSTRKMNQLSALSSAYKASVSEGAPDGSVWAALQAITRYVDHDRPSRGEDKAESQFASAQFGSGAQLKGKAMDLLMPMVRDRVALVV